MFRTSHPSHVPLNQPLVMAYWWLLTRAMCVHAIVIGLILAITPHWPFRAVSYEQLVFWGPHEFWGLTLIFYGVSWLLTEWKVRVAFGVLIAAWFFAFATAFAIAWVETPTRGTTATGVPTYLFIGWGWLCVSYVVWKDFDWIRKHSP